MALLAEGANLPLTGTAVTATVSGPVDVTALVVSADGKVAGDADMVFFNQPTAPGVRLDGRTLAMELTGLRPGAEKVVLVASPETAGATFAGVSVSLTLQHGGEAITITPSRLGVETVAVLAEVYQRGGAWKVRAVGQGYDSGLAGLAGDFGVDVDDPGAPATPVGPGPAAAPPTAPSPAPVPSGISFTKGEEKLPVDMRKKLTLRKQQVALVLTKHRMTGLRCRVVVVMDVSGSTGGLYRKGVFSRAVERVAPVAAQVDDGAEMQAWAMGAEARRLEDITIGTLPQWLERYTAKRYSDAGGWNNEKATIEDVARYVREEPLDIPTLVLFFHDGGVTDNKGTERALRAVEAAPVFWQFVGLGRSNYGILQRLDTLQGRSIDNTGFFALDDIDEVSDSELYERILAEFPAWMRAYYPAGHPALAGLS
ncbi:stress response protein SCP2 [Kineococcus xinjiangensis]|uniref:Stress response protein SCP2 n=1 Tax=Kineococcus xinjiangensis TaxID=512762 RepID=A0A2S6IEQ7_9ACTN|nr:VWA domain-containing protein [Kineococcus xinjiangensis]PPK92689.1 stress response protein SCP2 [Kineococcus xinjiangensis]